MKTIYKFPLAMQRSSTIHIPKPDKILQADFQGLELKLWVLCDPHSATEPVRVWVLATGEEVPDDVVPNLRYLNTANARGLYFHIFIEEEEVR
jgi:hypothetical protein